MARRAVIRVGTTRRNYVAEKTTYGARHPDLAFRRVPHLPLHAVTAHPFWRFVTGVWARQDVDLVHVFNDVPLSNRPWVASFEHDYPPRHASAAVSRAALRAAASSRCLGLFAMSAHARRRLLADPVRGPLLGPKCVVVEPCVPGEDDLYARHLAWLAEHPPGRGPLELLFAGNQFFRKGGEFVLDALEPLAARSDPPIRLTVVSTLELDSYVSHAHGDDARRSAALARIAAAPWIRRVEDVPPRRVRELMSESHLLLFPTLNETFGFVLAEALATGLEVVTVASRAIPEILPPALLPEAIRVPLGPDEEWAGTRLWRREGAAAWRLLWDDARERIVEGIRSRIAAILLDPSRLAARAPSLRAHHLARFAPERLGERLHAAYGRCLAAGRKS